MIHHRFSDVKPGAFTAVRHLDWILKLYTAPPRAEALRGLEAEVLHELRHLRDEPARDAREAEVKPRVVGGGVHAVLEHHADLQGGFVFV